MSPTFEPLNQADALNLQAFLESPSGRIVLARLRRERPPFGGSTSLEHVALRAKRAEGWEDCLEMIHQLAEARPTPAIENSPFMGPLDGSQ